MVREVKGDLCATRENIIAHQVNCKGVMGAGVAKQIKKKLLSDADFKTYVGLCKNDAETLLGRNHWCVHSTKRYIVNMFGEDNPTGTGLDTNYEALERCLKLLATRATERKLSIALPGYLGCGLAGGDWNIVYEMIEKVSAQENVDITLYYIMDSILLLWKEFGSVPMNPETECIEEEWHGFAAGTFREDIWKWFEDTFQLSIATDLMNI